MCIDRGMGKKCRVEFSSAVKKNGTVPAVGPGDSHKNQVTLRQNPLVSHAQNLDFEKT